MRVLLWYLKRRARRIPFVRRSLEAPIDTSIFNERPRGRVAWGLFIVSVASLMGLPFGTVLGAVATWLGRPGVATAGATIAYVVSIPLFALGLYLSGGAAMKFADVTIRLGVRFLARRLLESPPPPTRRRRRLKPVRR